MTKYDADNGKIKLPKAAFRLTDDKTGKEIATLVTDGNGEASVSLPYGSYTLTETQAPKGYKISDPIKFTLDESTVKYTDGTGTFKVTAKDTPIYGHINLTKTAPVLTGYKNDAFEYTEKSLAGAEYALYAKEDITSPDGSVTYYKAGTQISTGTTDSDGKIAFTRTDSKGNSTADMYLGDYYVVETKAPDGFTLDTTQHDVSLSVDLPDNDIRPTDPVPDTGDPTDTVDAIIGLTATVKNGTVETYSTLDKDNFVVTALCADGTKKTLTSDQFIIDPISAPKKSGKFTVTIKLNKTALPDEEADPQTTVDLIAKSTEAIFNASQLTTMDPQAAAVQQVKFIDIGKTEAQNRAKAAGVSLMDFSTEGNGSVLAWHDSNNVLYITSYEKGRKIIFDENCQSTFKDMMALNSIDFGKNIIDTSRVTDMGDMFYDCVMLTTLDLSEFDTSSVTKMGRLFRHCENLKTVNISSFDTTNVKDAGAMFGFCYKLESVDLSNISFPNAESMGYMFEQCKTLTKLDVSTLDGSKCHQFEGMFLHCENLVALNGISRLNTDKGDNFHEMFSYCVKLASLDISTWSIPEALSTHSMFYHCESLTSLDVSNFSMSKVANFACMFENCAKLTTLDVSNWDTSKNKNLSYVFKNCTNLRSVDVSGWDTSSVSDTPVAETTDVYIGNTTEMFSGCSSLISLDLHKWDVSGFRVMWAMFKDCSSLTTLNVSGWNTKNATSFGALFSGCSKLTTLDLSSWTSDNVVAMDYMFYNCENVTTLNLGKCNASNVTDTDAMFCGCKALKSVNLSKFNTKNDVRMGRLFADCQSLTTVDLSAFDTRNVEDISNMFHNCRSLITLDISGFRTPKLKHLTSAFTNCNNLKYLDMSNFDTSNLEDITGAFAWCDNLGMTITIRSTKLSSSDLSNVLANVGCADSGKATFVNYTNDATKAIAQTIVNTKGSGHAYLGSLVTTAAPTSLSTGSKASVLNAMDAVSDAAGKIASVQETDTEQEAENVGEGSEGQKVQDTQESTQDQQESGKITASEGTPRLYMGTNTSVQAADNSENLPQEIVKDGNGNVVEVNYSLDLTDDAQTCRIDIHKTDQAGADLAGATFALTALVDITDYSGNILIAKGSTVETRTSDENGMVSFGPLPTTRYAASTGDMYAVREVSAPDGYEKDSDL